MIRLPVLYGPQAHMAQNPVLASMPAMAFHDCRLASYAKQSFGTCAWIEQTQSHHLVKAGSEGRGFREAFFFSSPLNPKPISARRKYANDKSLHLRVSVVTQEEYLHPCAAKSARLHGEKSSPLPPISSVLAPHLHEEGWRFWCWALIGEYWS